MPLSTRRQRRSRRGGMRVEASSLREVLRDHRTHTAVGVVFVPTDSPNGKHWEVVTDPQTGSVDVMLHVELMPHREPLFVRLGSGGAWQVPAPGTEVGLVIPEGEIEADPFVACVLASGVAPAGLTETTVVVVAPVGGTVLVHDGATGTEEPLVRKSEFDGHTHGPGTFNNSGGSVAGVSDGAAAVTGTLVLRSK